MGMVLKWMILRILKTGCFCFTDYRLKFESFLSLPRVGSQMCASMPVLAGIIIVVFGEGPLLLALVTL